MYRIFRAHSPYLIDVVVLAFIGAIIAVAVAASFVVSL